MKLTIKSKDNIQYLNNNYTLDKNKVNLNYALIPLHNKLNQIKIKNYNYIRKSNINIIEEVETYFPNKIVDKINKTNYEEYTFKLKKNKYNFIIKLYSENTINIKNYILYIKLILLLFISYKPIDYNKYCSITIYLTDFEKIINDIPVKPYNINSGFTYGNNIKIYRKEEWFKVFIHECIHLFEFDFHNYSYFSDMKKYFPIKSNFLLYELYTEFWARIINISLLSLHKSFPIFKKRFHKYLKMEKLYSAVTANKILNINNLDYRGLLKPNTYNEETNVFCYYILSSLLFYYVNDTMYFFVSHNKNILDFNNKYVNSFKKYIIHLHKKEEWLTYLDNIKKYKTPNVNMALYEILF